jgi:hypothetical protein
MADLLPSFFKKKRFIRHFSSYLSDHEWSCIVAAGSPDEVLTVVQVCSLDVYEYIQNQSAFQVWVVASKHHSIS